MAQVNKIPFLGLSLLRNQMETLVTQATHSIARVLLILKSWTAFSYASQKRKRTKEKNKVETFTTIFEVGYPSKS